MSGLKNSPFGKRLRASHKDNDNDNDNDDHRRNRQRVNSIFPRPGSSSSSSSSASIDPPTPSKSSGRRTEYYGDRFVPSRDAGDMRTSFHLKDDATPSTPSRSRIIPSESDALKEQANAIFTSILHTEVTPPTIPSPHPSPSRTHAPSTPTRNRIFAYSSPSRSNPSTPSSSRALDSPNSSAYSMSPVRPESRDLLLSPRRHLRSVCKTPYRVLDAPELADDFYLNLVDWSSTNVLGVGLGSCVYLWTAHNAVVSKLCDLAPSGDTVSSVSWVQKGSTLAVGTLSGRLHIYDAEKLQLQRTYSQAHTQRIGALAWNSHILSSGSRDRTIHHRDVREREPRPFRRCAGHRQEVCGLKWSTLSDPGGGIGGAAGIGVTLASGGNDNKVCIWDIRGTRRTGSGPGRVTGTSAAILSGGSTFNPVSSISSNASVSATPPPSSIASPSIDGEEDDEPAPASPTPSYATSAATGPALPVIPTSNSLLPSSASAASAASTTIASSADLAPLFKFHEHTAAVKALAWDPHVAGVLATGGGTQDKHIRFWNVSTGTMLSELDTGSQVCNLVWSLTSHELVSTHGFSSTTAQNQICIWKYPALDMVASLTGHTNRVLYLAMSPDGETIVTGAGDETLRFWNAFPRRGRRGVVGSYGAGSSVGASGSGGGAGSFGYGYGGNGGGGADIGALGRSEEDGSSRLDYGKLIR